MTAIKYSNEIPFKEGSVWVRFDEDWGIDVTGENKEDGDLVGIASWDDLGSREIWLTFGEILTKELEEILEKEKEGLINDEVTSLIYEVCDAYDHIDVIEKAVTLYLRS